ncbi:hypothetical protein PVW48_01400 [Dinoroseobacter sp. PD6]|uniref:hypothetical protein n=1 Tax=Dinoroseobacter sp. PD6 TaxID=3028384 RepID=UPI00237AFE4E|nr:hypothetical protein [Dinoroseobacter sp. PD6]MDD9715385.1 hypothetical protein [Dinoroseobacter sp. PD6]
MKQFLFAAATALALVAAPTLALSETLTPIAELKRGTMVMMTGDVARITDEDEFILADATGRVPVYVGPNFVPAAEGETVTVWGWVDDDLFSNEVYARRIQRADGTVIELRQGY